MLKKLVMFFRALFYGGVLLAMGFSIACLIEPGWFYYGLGLLPISGLMVVVGAVGGAFSAYLRDRKPPSSL